VERPAAGAAEPSNLERRVRRGAWWNGANTILLRFGNFAVMAVVVHIVTPREFGVFAVALTVHMVVLSIGDAGMASALARGPVDPARYAPTVATMCLVSALLLGAAMALFAEPLATALGSRDAAGVMRVLAITVVLSGVFAVPYAELQRDFRQATLFRVNLLAFLPSNAVLVAMAFAGYGAMAFAWSRVVLQLLTGVGMMVKLRHVYLPGWSRSCVRPLVAFGVPFAAANLLNYVWLNTDYAFVGHMMGPVDLGVYMLAFNAAYWPTALLGPMLNSVGMAGFSRVSDQPERQGPALAGALRAVALVAMPVSALTLALAGPIVHMVYGAEWSAAALPLSILACYAATFTVSLLFANFLVGLGRTRVVLGIQLVWAICLVPAMVVGVKVAGIVGVATAHVVVVVTLMMPMYLYVLSRHFGTVGARALLAPLGRPTFAAASAAGMAFAVTRAVPSPIWQLVLGLAAGGALYVALARDALRAVLPLGRLAPIRLAVTPTRGRRPAA